MEVQSFPSVNETESERLVTSTSNFQAYTFNFFHQEPLGGGEIQTTCKLPKPLTPNSDQHLISPHNIAPKSHSKVMRIKEMIAN